jgi:protoporphyrinogen oxidase
LNKQGGTLIIGAGPAGLAAASELAQAKKNLAVIEKDDQVGGLAKTYIFQEGEFIFRTDNGPHRFFSKNPYLYKFISKLLQEQWLEVPRQTRQYIAGKFYDYPVRPLQALANIGPLKALNFIYLYSIAQIQYKLLKKPIKNFEDYIIAHFGKGLGRFNMINYTEKIWGVPANTIHADWAKQRIKGLSIGLLIKAALKNLLQPFKTKQVRTLVDVFYYPEYGTGLIYEKIKEELIDQGHQIHTKAYPTAIHHNNNRIDRVVVSNCGIEEVYEPDYLIESIPIESFLQLLNPAPPAEIQQAANKVKYRHQVYLFITLDRDQVTRDQWIYFPETNIPFGRISEMKNFSQKMSPLGKTSLFVEFFCFKNDHIWNKSKEELLALTMKYLESWGFCQRSEVMGCHLIKQEKVYPIYDTNYQDYLSIIKNYLNQFSNLFYIGRPGRFRYTNQDHSLEMGMLAARSIIDNQRYNIDDVGKEQEYYERGIWKK